MQIQNCLMPVNSYLSFQFQFVSAMVAPIVHCPSVPELFTLIPCPTSLPCLGLHWYCWPSSVSFCPDYLSQTSSAAHCATLPARHLFDELRSNSSCQLSVLLVVSLVSLRSAWSCAAARVSSFNFRGHSAMQQVPQFYILKIRPLCTSGAWSERVLTQLPVQLFTGCG